jgi:hypothetical protein
VPPPVVSWALESGGSGGPAGERLAELSAGGSAGVAGLLMKGGGSGDGGRAGEWDRCGARSS